ncbi:MAG: magnesium/cobalt transporter CorA [Chitinophagaceae bacterium]
MKDITVVDYNEQEAHEYHPERLEDCFPFRDNANVTWVNLSGLDKDEVHRLCMHYQIHYLFEQDILSHGQRPKMDEQDNIIFCLLNMLRIDEQTERLDKEQVSIVLGPGFVITFQEEPYFDAFKSIRENIKSGQNRIRLKGADFLCYSMLDAIVDDYSAIIDDYGDRIENYEDDLVLKKNYNFSISNMIHIRKDLTLLRRNIIPVREIISNLLKTSNTLIEKNTERYFKDIYDHILQAQDIMESYHDTMVNLHDLYLNKSSLKMNESMNVMAVVTCLLAPATVFSGIFGMNFEHIPYLHAPHSFYVLIAIVLVIMLFMLVIFRVKRWI